MFIVPLCALLASCTDPGTGPGPGLLADHSNIADPADGSPLPADRWGAFRTIPELLALARSIDPTHVASFHVEYDPRYGYPRSIYVDPSAQIADEEYGYETAIILEHELAEKP